MELKVWVEGVVRVVCGLSLDTSCQDVVIALAQAIGQTGRYVFILKFRGNERQLVADDCPLQCLAQLGQLAPEVQFILRRTGPSVSNGPDTTTRERHLPLPRPSEPEPFKHREPHKALTFNLGPSTVPRRTKPNRAWSPSPRASPEPRASPVSIIDTSDPMRAVHAYPPKEEVFRQILQQQRRLQDLEIQLQDLETEVWEQERSSTPCPNLTLDLAEELEELEQRLRENEAELMDRDNWRDELQAEVDREQDMHQLLQRIHSSLDDHSCQISELEARSTHLEQDVRLAAQRRRAQEAQQQEEALGALGALRQELLNRLHQGDQLDVTLSETQRELQAAEDMLKDRLELTEELNKELRQCNLQQFIQQSADQTNSLVTEVYLSNAGIME